MIMKLEEAKQLKTGDRVLIEAEVVQCIDQDFDVYLSLKSTVDGKEHCEFFSFEYITKKIMPTCRKFKVGDIVIPKGYETPLLVTADEKDGVVETFNAVPFSHELLILVCAVEDRKDRKGGKK